MKIYNTIIVGGGTAGLMTAVELASGSNNLNGEDVIILERNDRVGKKLIATGNGQGNLANAVFSADNYYGERNFIETFVKLKESINIEKYLFSLGIPLCVAKDGKKYPLSKQASSVLDMIRAKLSYCGIREITDSKVEYISFDKNLYTVSTKNTTFKSKHVVLATGGAAAKQFGTDGTAYALAEKFGHKLTPLYPSLVQLKTECNTIKGLKGLKETVRLTALDGDKLLKTVEGEVLFTEYGISGNAVFYASACLTSVKSPVVKLEFLPENTKEEIIDILSARAKTGYIGGEQMLSGMVNKRIGQAVLKTAKTLSPKDVAEALKNFTLKVTGNLGFNYAQVTKGGLSTDDFNPYTMESKLSKNFYAVGEILDVDGDCGGYNVTFAFVSAILAARAIKADKSK